jgi:hypothetical protein
MMTHWYRDYLRIVRARLKGPVVVMQVDYGWTYIDPPTIDQACLSWSVAVPEPYQA